MLIENDAAEAVTDQLAGQGLLAKTRTKGGDEALILRVDVVEQYAASLVILARHNPRSVPAFPEADLGTRRNALPGIEPSTRLEWTSERVVLECVAELMIGHGVCFRHQGLLVFPTLFPEAPTEAEAEKLPHTVSLWYDFTGAIDNVYASLVAGLMVLRPFGPGRLTPGSGRVRRPGTRAVRTAKAAPAGRAGSHRAVLRLRHSTGARDAFVAYVEAHLRENGVEVTECRAIKCPECGKEITEETVRERIADGREDVVCSRCERRTPIQEGMTGGVAEIRQRDPRTDAKVLALRQEIKAKLALDVAMAKAVISGVAGETLDRNQSPFRSATSSTSRVTSSVRPLDVRPS